MVTGISTPTYERLNELRYRYVEEVGDGGNFVPTSLRDDIQKLFVTALSELGYFRKKEMGFRADTPEQLRKTLANLAIGGFRTAISLEINGPDISGLHMVGAKRVSDDLYHTVSTWSPFEDEPVTSEQIYILLDRPARLRRRQNSAKKSFKDNNIFALPPEKPGSLPPFWHV